MSKGKPKDLVEKQFAREFIANGMNSTQAYVAVKAPKNMHSARVQASRLLSKDSVQQHIRDLLPSDDVESGIIHKAFNADLPSDISWKDLRGYTELSLKLKGYLNTNPQGQQMNIAFIVNKK